MLTERDLQRKSVQHRQARLRLIKTANAGHALGELVRTFEAAPFRPGKPSAVLSDSRGSAKLAPFAKAVPGQIVEVGIAEQNLVGVAAGLAATARNLLAKR